MAGTLWMNISALKKKFQSAYGTSQGPTSVSDFGEDIPEDYASFLRDIGGGTVGDMFFEIYSKPLKSCSIYGNDAPDHLKSLLFIGDDYNRYLVALDPNKQWAVVEIDKHSREAEVLSNSFFDFLSSDWRFNPKDEEV